MTLHWYTVVVDSHDARAQARWWAEVLEWQIVHEAEDEAVILPSWVTLETLEEIPWERRGQGMVFVPVPEEKTLKNRLHIDLAPHSSQDREAEIRRLIDMGARRAQVGQDEVTWTVLTDPEGNEFCVLSSRER